MKMKKNEREMIKYLITELTMKEVKEGLRKNLMGTLKNSMKEINRGFKNIK